MKKLLAVLLCLGLCGCVSLRTVQNLSSGKIGCPPDEIKITNLQPPGLSPMTWVAECKGIKYYCTESVTASCAQAK